MNKYITSLFLLSSISLTGCTHSPIKQSTSVTSPQQVEQLATLVAASSFLRENCQRSDVPAQPQLIKTALVQAQSKGWVLTGSAKAELQQRGDAILSALNQDGSPLAEKCAYFNQNLAAFIEQARRLSS